MQRRANFIQCLPPRYVAWLAKNRPYQCEWSMKHKVLKLQKKWNLAIEKFIPIILLYLHVSIYYLAILPYPENDITHVFSLFHFISDQNKYVQCMYIVDILLNEIEKGQIRYTNSNHYIQTSKKNHLFIHTITVFFCAYFFHAQLIRYFKRCGFWVRIFFKATYSVAAQEKNGSIIKKTYSKKFPLKFIWNCHFERLWLHPTSHFQSTLTIRINPESNNIYGRQSK